MGLGKALKKLGKGLTKVAKIAAPVVGMFNPAIGAGLGVVGGLGHGKSSLKKMALGGLMGGAGGLAGKALGIGGAAGGGGGGLAAKFGGITGGLRKLGAGIKANPELALGAASLFQQHQAGQRADRAARQADEFARQEYAEAAPLRKLGMESLVSPRVSNFSPRPVTPFDAGHTSNPFSY
jgi:hypothetical protein